MILFRANGDGTYDLLMDGRIAAYDVEPDDFSDALRRARYAGGSQVMIEDETGYREPLGA